MPLPILDGTQLSIRIYVLPLNCNFPSFQIKKRSEKKENTKFIERVFKIVRLR